MWRKGTPSYTADGNVNWFSHYGEQYGDCLNTELLRDPAIPLLSIYLDKIFIQKEACPATFIAALFIIPKPWKQPKCPSIDEWIKKMWYMHTMKYYSAIKKDKVTPFAAT